MSEGFVIIIIAILSIVWIYVAAYVGSTAFFAAKRSHNKAVLDFLKLDGGTDGQSVEETQGR